MPELRLDAVDAAELAELLQFLAGWLARDPDRLTFLLGGDDGESLSGPDAPEVG